MPEPFLPIANISSAVKSILDHYPLLDGPIRELLQNSDDAKATTQVRDWSSFCAFVHFTQQVFIIDRRQRPISSIVSADYIDFQQSPALVAYNDAYFEPQDWESLKSLFESNKVHDLAYAHLKTFYWGIITDIAFRPFRALGQFGQGFRCVYHVWFLHSPILSLLTLICWNTSAIVDWLPSDFLWDYACALESSGRQNPRFDGYIWCQSNITFFSFRRITKGPLLHSSPFWGIWQREV